VAGARRDGAGGGGRRAAPRRRPAPAPVTVRLCDTLRTCERVYVTNDDVLFMYYMHF
jgi:hypothetical protein